MDLSGTINIQTLSRGRPKLSPVDKRTNKMRNLVIDDSKTYTQLENMGIIDSDFYEINDIDLTKPYALIKKPINVVDVDAGKFVGLEFTSRESAQSYINAVIDTARYDGFI